MKDGTQLSYEKGALERLLGTWNLPSDLPRGVKDYLEKENEFLLKNVNGGKLLDVGCGFGRHLLLLSNANKIGLGVGVDIVLSYLKRGIRDIHYWEIGPLASILEFIRGDALHLPFDNNSFDVVICMNNTLGNISDYESAVEEMFRVVKKGGAILVGVYAQGSTPDRVLWYDRTGLPRVTRITKHFIELRDGFVSRHFGREELEELFGKDAIIERVINPFSPLRFSPRALIENFLARSNSWLQVMPSLIHVSYPYADLLKKEHDTLGSLEEAINPLNPSLGPQDYLEPFGYFIKAIKK